MTTLAARIISFIALDEACELPYPALTSTAIRIGSSIS